MDLEDQASEDRRMSQLLDGRFVTRPRVCRHRMIGRGLTYGLLSEHFEAAPML